MGYLDRYSAHHPRLRRTQIRRQTGKRNVPGDTEERILTRLDELERRVTDIQDVMIALDEKLQRESNES